MTSEKTNDSTLGAEVLTVDYEDELQEPPHDLQEHHRPAPKDRWLGRSVLERTPQTVLAEPAPQVTRIRFRRAVQKATRANDRPSLLERIRALAYQFFEQRGYEHGHDVEDWLRAKEIVLSQQAQSPPGDDLG